MTRNRLIGTRAFITGAAVSLLCGCGGSGGPSISGGDGGGGTTPGNNLSPPAITRFQVSPASLGFAGGPVTYTVVAADPDGGSVTVTVMVTPPDGNLQSLPQKTGPSGTFEIPYTSPANVGATAQVQTYTAVAQVSDGKNTVTASGANHTVSPPDAGPPPPPPPVLP